MTDYDQIYAEAVKNIPKLYETQANDVLRNMNLGPTAMEAGDLLGTNTTIGARPEGQLVPYTDQFGKVHWVTWEMAMALRAQAQPTGDQGGEEFDQGVPIDDDISDTTIGENGGPNGGEKGGPGSFDMSGNEGGGDEQVAGVTAAELQRFRKYKAAGGEVNDPLGWKLQGFPEPRSAGARAGGKRTPFENLFQMAEAAGGAIRFADGSVNPKTVAQFEAILGKELTENEIRLVQARMNRINRSLFGDASLESGGQMGGNQRNQMGSNQASGNQGWAGNWAGNFGQDMQADASRNIYGSSVERSPFTPFELTRSVEDMFKDYRLGSYPGATLRGLTGAGGRALTAGSQPAFGSFLLQSASNPDLHLPVDWRGDEGENIPTAFRQYLGRGMEGARPSLQDLRSGFGGLTNYLTDIGRPGAMQEDAAWAGHMPYMQVFGTDPNRAELLAAAGSALRGPRGFGSRTQTALGNMYDLFETRYGAGGMGKFGQFVQSAYGG